jgi:hypothetical protein
VFSLAQSNDDADSLLADGADAMDIVGICAYLPRLVRKLDDSIALVAQLLISLVEEARAVACEEHRSV